MFEVVAIVALASNVFENDKNPKYLSLKVLLSSSQTEHKVKSRFLLNIVIREGSTIL